MIGLIKKDLYYLMTSWKVIVSSIVIIAWFATTKNIGAIIITVLPTFFGLSILGCIQQDAQKKWYEYYKILPIVPNQIVASRYLAYLCFVGIGFIFAAIYGYGVQFSLGIESLGKNFTMMQAFQLGGTLALGFASFFIPATYYNKGEKMEVSMIISSFFSFGAIYLASNLLKFIGVNLMDYSHIIIQILFVVSIIAFIISWLISNLIYNKKRYN